MQQSLEIFILIDPSVPNHIVILIFIAAILNNHFNLGLREGTHNGYFKFKKNNQLIGVIIFSDI